MNKDNKSAGHDPIEDTAWSWVMRQHETPQFDEPTGAELATWLTADPAHRRAYDKASHLWLLAGLLPPVNDISSPDEAEPDEDDA